MLIKLGPFKGIAPKINSTMLPDAAATTAHNCTLKSGALKPLAGTSAVSATLKTGNNTSIYLYDDQYWLSWVDKIVHVVPSPIPGDSYKRLYWTGDGAPKMADLATITTGGTLYPVNSYNLGLPVPAAAITATVTGTATSTDPLDADTRSYVYCYVSAWGEEGPPSAPSAAVDVYPGQSVDISAMSTAPAGAYNVSFKTIYRTNSGTNTTEYQLVAVIPVANTTYNDSKAADELGEVLPSADWDAPPADLKGLIPLPCGSLCGYRDNELYFSVPYLPHAWPASYILSFADKIMGIGAYGASTLVATDGAPYVVTGQAPGSMSQERLEGGHGCISSNGVVDMGYTVVYPATDGLMAAGVGGVNLLTAELLGITEWRNLIAGMSFNAAAHYDNQYLALTGTAAAGYSNYIFDSRTGDLTTFDNVGTVTCGFNDPATGTLYLCTGQNVVQWEGGGSLTMSWKSKLFTLPQPANFGAAQVVADAYPVTMKVYADGALKHTQTVSSQEPFRLPAGFKATKWQIELSGTNTITMAAMASTVAELAQA